MKKSDMKFLRLDTALIRIEEINLAYVSDDVGNRFEFSETAEAYYLVVIPSASGGKLFFVDKFDVLGDAIEALTWLGTLLEGLIDALTWGAGRTDKNLRMPQ